MIDALILIVLILIVLMLDQIIILLAALHGNYDPTLPPSRRQRIAGYVRRRFPRRAKAVPGGRLRRALMRERKAP